MKRDMSDAFVFFGMSGDLARKKIFPALYARFASRGQADFADKLLSAMRKEFGGHDEKLDQTIGETK